LTSARQRHHPHRHHPSVEHQANPAAAARRSDRLLPPSLQHSKQHNNR
jgi:hypothetical protein